MAQGDWATALVSTQLALSGSWQTVQRAAADWELAVPADQIANVLFKFGPEATPTEFCRIAACASPDDGTDFESPESASAQKTLNFEDSVGTDYTTSVTNNGGMVLEGGRKYRFQARLFDPDGAAGGTDTGSKLDIEVALGEPN